MRAFSPMELLAAWEIGETQPRTQRALTLLAAGTEGESAGQLATLSIGQRDAALLELREQLFGSRLQSLADCPQCGALLEFAISTEELRLPTLPLGEILKLNHGDLEVCFRLPNSHDLALLDPAADAATGERFLLERCLLSAGEKTAADLSPELLALVGRRMEQADAQADLQLVLTCPDCACRWHSAFDILSFLWSEISALARRLLREVHVLASAYGWTESAILTMSTARRNSYLEMVQP